MPLVPFTIYLPEELVARINQQKYRRFVSVEVYPELIEPKSIEKFLLDSLKTDIADQGKTCVGEPVVFIYCLQGVVTEPP